MWEYVPGNSYIAEGTDVLWKLCAYCFAFVYHMFKRAAIYQGVEWDSFTHSDWVYTANWERYMTVSF